MHENFNSKEIKCSHEGCDKKFAKEGFMKAHCRLVHGRKGVNNLLTEAKIISKKRKRQNLASAKKLAESKVPYYLPDINDSVARFHSRHERRPHLPVAVNAAQGYFDDTSWNPVDPLQVQLDRVVTNFNNRHANFKLPNFEKP